MTRSRSIIWLVIAAVFFVWFAMWQTVPLIRKFQSDSEGLVVRALREKAEGTYRLGGFMIYGFENERIYTSQYGLQHKIFDFLRPRNLPVDSFVPLARLATAALFAMTLALFVTTVRYEFGNIAAWTVFGGILASPWLALFVAPNLYWVIFTHFLPFVAAWALYPRLKRVFWVFTAVIAFLVFIKSLSGYEFLSNIALSPIVPLLYYELKNNARLSAIFRKTAAVFSTAVIGFGGALALHMAQSKAYFGTPWRVVRDLAQGMPTDTVGMSIWPLWLKTIPQYVIGTPQPDAGLGLRLAVGAAYLASMIPLATGLLIIAYAWSARKRPDTPLRTGQFSALFSATAFAYLASFSWAVLGAGHFAYHPHVDSIIFYLPANLMAFIFIPVVVRKLLSAKCAPA